MKKFFSLVVLFFVITTYGAVTVNVNGSNYSIPQTSERGWGTAVTSWIQAISSNTLQPIGGSFTLSNDVDFGPNFGLKTSYLLSRNTNPSSAGLLRLNVADSIGWRNNANDGNLLLGVNGSNQLTFNGSALLSSGNIVNADISASAGIDASKIANGQVSNTEFQALDGVSAPIVTTTGTQSLSNKDIDGGTASNSNRITIPKAAKTTLDALTRKQGTIVYDTTSNKPYYDDGANLKVIGSGSGGATNLIEDGDAESGITNFVEGSYSAATRPSGTFTASSGAGAFAISTSSSSPIFGSNSFLLTKSSGASRQGRAIERTIAIDAGYRTKMLKTRIDYTIVSGTFVAGSNGSSPTDSSLIWYVGQYNGSTWSYTEPSTFKMFSNSTTNSDWVEGEFQVNSDTTQIKLIGFISESANSAWVVKAEVGFRLSTYLAGTTITDWVDYTPTGSFTNTTYTGKWRRVGDSIEAFVYAVVNHVAGPSPATFSVNYLPSGLTADSTKLNQANGVIYGYASILDSGSRTYTGSAVYNSASSVKVVHTETGSSGDVSDSAPFTFTINDSISLHLTVPIVGWSSSTQQSDGYDGRKVDLQLSTNAGTIATSATTWTTITFSTPEIDDASGWNGTDTYTIKSAGDYEIGLMAGQNSAAANYFRIGYQKNSDSEVVLGQGIGKAGGAALPFGSKVLRLAAGDTIKFKAFTEGTEGIGATRSAYIKKILAPTTISATELIAAGYSLSANKTPAANAALDFDSKLYDTHNAVTTGGSGVWKFTAPAPGIYEMCVNAALSSGNQTLDMYKNGVQGKVLMSVSTMVTSGCASISLIAGDYISANPDGSVTFTATKNTNIYIKRLK